MALPELPQPPQPTTRRGSGSCGSSGRPLPALRDHSTAGTPTRSEPQRDSGLCLDTGAIRIKLVRRSQVPGRSPPGLRGPDDIEPTDTTYRTADICSRFTTASE